MSPSEFELRAALHDGESDDVDVDGLVAGVRERRAQRRTRVLSAAAAVVVVAAAAVGGSVLWGGSDGGAPQAADPSVSAARSRSQPLPVDSNSPATSPPTAVPVTCASSAPRPIDPPARVPTTSVKTFMFTAPVRTFVVCSYTDGATPKQVTLTGSAATALAEGIEKASPSRARIICPDITTGVTTLLALVPVTADGTVLPTVSTDISIPDCNEPISNGTAVRYNWRPPQSLRTQLAAQR